MERWNRCPCPCCPPEGKRHVICAACQNSGDLLLRPERIEVGTELQDDYRSLSFDSGPLPVVSVRLEELVSEEPCPERHDPRKGLHEVVIHGERIERYSSELAHRNAGCVTCSGTGVVRLPSPWLRALPPEYDVAAEGVEPLPDNGGVNPTYVGWHPRRNVPLWLWELIESPHRHGEWKDYLSPAAAHAALRQGLRRWRYA